MARALALLITALASVAFLASPVLAQYPPAEGPTTAASTTSVVAGGSFTLSGSGWSSGTSVSFTLFSRPVDLGTAPVDAAGNFSAVITIPVSTPAGVHTLRTSGIGQDGSARTADLQITILAGATGAGGAGQAAATGSGDGARGLLPFTGGLVPFTTTSAIAALLLVAGVGALYVSRRISKAEVLH